MATIDHLEGLITSDDILGKQVIDTEGDFLGIVEKVHIDPANLDIIGISIDKGFLHKGLAVGKDFIKKVTPHAIFLTIRPAYKMRGMAVFDTRGKKVGIVEKLELTESGKHMRAVDVRIGIRKSIRIPSDKIASVGNNVLLSCRAGELKTEAEAAAAGESA